MGSAAPRETEIPYPSFTKSEAVIQLEAIVDGLGCIDGEEIKVETDSVVNQAQVSVTSTHLEHTSGELAPGISPEVLERVVEETSEQKLREFRAIVMSLNRDQLREHCRKYSLATGGLTKAQLIDKLVNWYIEACSVVK